MRKKVIRLALLLCTALLCTYCKSSDSDVTVPEAENEAAVVSDLLNNIGRAYETADLVLRAGSLSDTTDIDTIDCATVKKGMNGPDSTLVITYNQGGCTDSKTRVGRIRVFWRNAGWRGPLRIARIQTSTTTTADEHRVNNDLYSYSLTIHTSNFGIGVSPVDTLRGTVGVVSSTTGAASNISLNPWLRTWQAGADNPKVASTWIFEYSTPSDSLAGSAFGTLPYKAKVRGGFPLRRRATCGGFTRGIIEIKPTSKSLRTLDYGADVCDNVAVLSVDGRQTIVNF